MPISPIKNVVYQMLLPFQAPSPKGQMSHLTEGRKLNGLADYEKLLCAHHVLGASLFLKQADEECRVYTSTMLKPVHHVNAYSYFRTASITKMSTAIVTAMLAGDGAFTLDTEVSELLPIERCEALDGITVRHLLSHTSGLRDIPAADMALKEDWAIEKLLEQPDVRKEQPGTGFSYCNLNYGLLGCVIEYLTNQPVQEVFEERLFSRLGMRGALDASRLETENIVPISRVLPYHDGQDTVIPPYAAVRMENADPHHHYHHTAGSLYTDAGSLSKMLSLIANHGEANGKQLIPSDIVRQMVREHGSYGKDSPNLRYGLGFLIVEDRQLSKHRLIGHQGYAYGCADGAFYEEGTGRQVIFLNGGCSEARTGHFGRSNFDILRFCLQEEMPSWK